MMLTMSGGLASAMHGRTSPRTAAHQQLRRALAALALIDVRIGAIGDSEVAMVNETLRHVAVQVEGYDDGNVWPQRSPQSAEDLAVGVGLRLRDHRAVQGQQQAVGPIFAEFGDQTSRDFVENGIGRPGPAGVAQAMTSGTGSKPSTPAASRKPPTS